MRFRRLRTRMRAQDWFGAGVDLVLVVLGVFLGIQMSNWNEARRERSEERRYYEQVLRDLRTDLKTLATAKRRADLHDRAAELTLAALESGVPRGETAGEVALSIHWAGFLYLPYPSRGTYDELVSTGNLGLLREPALKTALARYYENFERDRQWDPLLREHQKEYWSTTAGVLPRPLLRRALRGRTADVTAAEIAAILAEARTRDRLPDLLVAMAAHQERVRRDSEHLEQEARALIDLLEARLN